MIAAATALFTSATWADQAPPPSAESSRKTSPAEAKKTEDELAAPWTKTLDLGVHIGTSIRLGGSPSLEITERAGLLAGGWITLSPSRLFGIDLAYEHINLGADRLGDRGVNSADVRRDAHTLWADLLVHPIRIPSIEVFAAIGLGLAWQRADANGVIDPSGVGTSIQLFQCSASAAASVGLRGSVGMTAPLGGGLLFVTDASFESARLSGELLDRCISGAGTTSIFALRVGLAARFDLSRIPL